MAHDPPNLTVEWAGQTHRIIRREGFHLLTDKGELNVDDLRVWLPRDRSGVCNDPEHLQRMLGERK